MQARLHSLTSQTDGVASIKHGIHGSITRDIYFTVIGNDCDTFTQHTLGKSRIGNFCYRHGLTSHRSKNMIGIKGFFFLTKQFIKKTHIISFFLYYLIRAKHS